MSEQGNERRLEVVFLITNYTIAIDPKEMLQKRILQHLLSLFGVKYPHNLGFYGWRE